MTPDEIRNQMEHSTFAHDLNPSEAAGSSDGLTITASGSQSDERNATPGSLADPNFFHVAYAGKSSIKKITFFGETASPTSIRGLVFDPRKLAKPGLYEDGGFPFTVGRADGVKKGSIDASFSKRFAALPEGRLPAPDPELPKRVSARVSRSGSGSIVMPRCGQAPSRRSRAMVRTNWAVPSRFPATRS